MRGKHQRKRIKPSIFQKGSKKNPRRLNRGNSMVRSFRKQKTVESFCMFINLTKKRFDRESKNPKEKRIKSKPIQQKNSIKSNISYPNLKNWGGGGEQCTVPNRCSVYRSTSFSISFSMSQASSSLYFIASLFLGLSLFHRLSIYDSKYQSINKKKI